MASATGGPSPPTQQGFVTTNDGVRLAYEQAGPTEGKAGPPIVLIHGWSGSRRYFSRNLRALATRARVFALDLRFHGESESPPWGFHVARLAADLHDFLAAVLHGPEEKVTLLGTSMGCAVIWSYVELFGEGRLAGAVFVDQAPLQNRAPDWQLGSRGCYDAESLARLQAQLTQDNMPAFADGNAACCLSLPVPADVASELKAETLRCDPQALSRLMADHTALDWRPVIRRRLTVPCLNVVGGDSGVFPPEGCLAVQELARDCRSVVFARANHWLYLELPDQFNELVVDFLLRGNEGRPEKLVVP